MELIFIVCLSIGAVIFAVLWYGTRISQRTMQLRLEEMQRLHQQVLIDHQQVVDQLQQKIASYESQHLESAKTEATLRSECSFLKERLDQQKNDLERVYKEMGAEFRVMANDILEEKSKRFTEVNRSNISAILDPLNQKLGEFKSKVEETYDKESKERFSLDSRIKELVELNKKISDEANNLTRALKGDNKTQGDWGEMVLESILDRSGLKRNENYFVQSTLVDDMGRTLTSEEGKRMRPDVIVKYPDKRCVIVDSKVSLSAYLRYINSDEEDEALQAKNDHVRSVRSHIDELSKKSYQDYTDTTDFVMMFVPNEAAYLVAMQHDNELWSYAYDRRIVMLGPTNLIAALKIVVDMWTRDDQTRNHLEIAERGAQLYDKFVGFVESMQTIGDLLDRTSRSYSQAMGQLKEGRGNLIGQVDKLRKLGVKAKKQLPASIEDEEEDDENQA